jgi:hypothetical protein
MEIGLVSKYNDIGQRGVIVSPHGDAHSFRYIDGQSMMSGDDLMVPLFTGRHDQRSGFQLKVPRVGDAVIFAGKPGENYVVWGYLQHFLDLVERKYGSDFIPRAKWTSLA